MFEGQQVRVTWPDVPCVRSKDIEVLTDYFVFAF